MLAFPDAAGSRGWLGTWPNSLTIFNLVMTQLPNKLLFTTTVTMMLNKSFFDVGLKLYLAI
jgi:hypothetical protein